MKATQNKLQDYKRAFKISFKDDLGKELRIVYMVFVLRAIF